MAKIMDIIKNKDFKTVDETTEITLVTHCSKPVFHADEVAATALLKFLFQDVYKFKNVKVVKTFDPAKMGYTDDTPNCVIYDVGMGMYDHHQHHPDDAHCIREDSDGVKRKYSSVGLIWKEIGHLFVKDEYVESVYNSFIKYIDDNDNGFGYNPLSYAISNMNTYANSKSDNEKEFNLAVTIFSIFFINIISTCRRKTAESKAAEYLVDYAKKYNKGIYAYSSSYVPSILNICAKEGVPFYIYPNVRGGYVFRTITPIGGEMNDHLIDIPEEVRNWDGVNFLHHSCFMGSADTKERAIEIVEKIYEDSKKK